MSCVHVCQGVRVMLRLGSRQFGPHDFAVMAVVNRTPDSFYDGGANVELDSAVDACARAADEGADVVDIGGVRAGHGAAVDVAEELRRVLPVVSAVRERFPALLISVDTWRAEVARLGGGGGGEPGKKNRDGGGPGATKGGG
ncbi:MAG: dihydropteroate synthase, partial [Jatrophihabitantaceae bacterium]